MYKDTFIYKYKKSLIFLVLVIIALLIVIKIIDNDKFRIVSTNPSLSSVSNVTPSINVNFNRELAGQSLTISSTDKIVKSYTLSGKTISLSLNYPSSINERYNITFSEVYSVNKSILKNVTISFTPKSIPFQDLSKSQQKTELENQEPKKTLVFNNANSLINYGMTVSQLNQIEEYIIKFKPAAENITFNTIGLTDTKSNTDQGTVFTMGYSLTIDGVTYQASSSYLGDSINLVLSQNGNQVFSDGSY